MKILLQQKNDGLYFKESGVWTRDAAEGMEFLSSTQATDYCIANHISDVQIVLRFEEQHHDIVLPVRSRCAHRARRRAYADCPPSRGIGP